MRWMIIGNNKNNESREEHAQVAKVLAGLGEAEGWQVSADTCAEVWQGIRTTEVRCFVQRTGGGVNSIPAILDAGERMAKEAEEQTGAMVRFEVFS